MTLLIGAGRRIKLARIKKQHNPGSDELLDALTDFMNNEAPKAVRRAYSDEDYNNPYVEQWEKFVFKGTPWCDLPWLDVSRASGKRM